MKTFYHNKKLPSAAAIEIASGKILMEKMGLTPEEFQEINDYYGVSASKLLELMQLSKYQFILPAKVPGQCDACTEMVREGRFVRL